jgi:two-component system, OmpR family, sensor histidine kinase BaeS
LKVNQLWKKLALGLIGVAVAAIVVAYLLVNYAIDIRFRGYVNLREQAVYQRIGDGLALTYIEYGGWDHRLAGTLPHFSMMNKVAMEVVDNDGRVVAKSAPDLTVSPMRPGKPSVMGLSVPKPALKRETVKMPIIAEGRRVGTVFITPQTESASLVEDQQFRRAINSSLVFGGLLAALVALGLSFLISTWLTRPLGLIAKAAKRMEGGDLSQRVELNTKDEIGQLGEAFNHLAMALQRQGELRKNLTADVAHELRTPLAVIRSHIEAFMDGVMVPDAQQLESIHQEIMRLGRLIDDLGELARAEGGKLRLDKKPIDVSELAGCAAAALAPLFEERQVTLRTKTSEPVVGVYDEDKLKQVIVNLLSNAAKFTPPGGRVGLKVDGGSDEALITIIDTGVGIDEESLPFIFERFYRVDKSRNRSTGGSGIGLTIAAELVKAHGGKIEVGSKPGAGSIFTVKLPKNGK